MPLCRAQHFEALPTQAAYRGELMDTRELRELAKRATPGPWFVDGDGDYLRKTGSDAEIWAGDPKDNPTFLFDTETGTHDPDKAEANAAYIAALSPDVLEGLCNRIDALEKGVAKLSTELVRERFAKGVVQSAAGEALPWMQDGPIWKERAEKAESERDALRAELDAAIKYAQTCNVKVRMSQDREEENRQAYEAENERLRDALRELVNVVEFGRCSICREAEGRPHDEGCVVLKAAALLTEAQQGGSK
jgi:hypothetical protein